MMTLRQGLTVFVKGEEKKGTILEIIVRDDVPHAHVQMPTGERICVKVSDLKLA